MHPHRQSLPGNSADPASTTSPNTLSRTDSDQNCHPNDSSSVRSPSQQQSPPQKQQPDSKATASKQPPASSSQTDSAAAKAVSPVRKRLSLACTTCRQRKVKCDGARPACKTCAKFKWPCMYLPSNRKRGPRPRGLALMSTAGSGYHTSTYPWSTSPTHNPYTAASLGDVSAHQGSAADYRYHSPHNHHHHSQHIPRSARQAPYTTPSIPGPVDRASTPALSAQLSLYNSHNFSTYGDFLSNLSSPVGGSSHGHVLTGNVSHNSRRGPINQLLYRQSHFAEPPCLPSVLQESGDTTNISKHANGQQQRHHFPQPLMQPLQPPPSLPAPGQVSTISAKGVENIDKPLPISSSSNGNNNETRAKHIEGGSPSSSLYPALAPIKLPNLPMVGSLVSSDTARPRLPPIEVTPAPQGDSAGARERSFRDEVEKMFTLSPVSKPSLSIAPNSLSTSLSTECGGAMNAINGAKPCRSSSSDTLALPPLPLISKPRATKHPRRNSAITPVTTAYHHHHHNHHYHNTPQSLLMSSSSSSSLYLAETATRQSGPGSVDAANYDANGKLLADSIPYQPHTQGVLQQQQQ